MLRYFDQHKPWVPAAGVALLRMRRSAVLWFAAYLLWGGVKVITQTVNFPGYLSLALIAGAWVNCLRLRKNAVLN